MNDEYTKYEQDGQTVLIMNRRFYQQFWAVVNPWPLPESGKVNVCESHPGYHRTAENAMGCASRYLRAQKGSPTEASNG